MGKDPPPVLGRFYCTGEGKRDPLIKGIQGRTCWRRKIVLSRGKECFHYSLQWVCNIGEKEGKIDSTDRVVICRLLKKYLREGSRPFCRRGEFSSKKE